MFKMGADLVQAPSFWGCFDKADFSVVMVVSGADGFELGSRRVGIWNDGLADIDFTGLVFAESI